MATAIGTNDKVSVKAGNVEIFYAKAQAREGGVEQRHPALTYAAFKAAAKKGFRGDNGVVHVLLYKSTDGSFKGSVKVVNPDGSQEGTIWVSKNMVNSLLGKHQDELGQWQNVVKLHVESGNATVPIPASELRIYGLKNEAGEEWSVVGSAATGGAGMA
jgi:hypothetical protein